MGANNDDSPLRLVLLIIINGYWLNHQHAVVVVVVLTIILLLLLIIIIVIRSPFSTHLAYLSSTNPLSELTLLSGDAMLTIYGGPMRQNQNPKKLMMLITPQAEGLGPHCLLGQRGRGKMI